jgi:hypothetical protein
MKAHALAKARAPVKAHAPAKARAPVKAHALAKARVPVKAHALAKARAPGKAHAPMKAHAPVKARALAKALAPGKLHTAASTPQTLRTVVHTARIANDQGVTVTDQLQIGVGVVATASRWQGLCRRMAEQKSGSNAEAEHPRFPGRSGSDVAATAA